MRIRALVLGPAKSKAHDNKSGYNNDRGFPTNHFVMPNVQAVRAAEGGSRTSAELGILHATECFSE